MGLGVGFAIRGIKLIRGGLIPSFSGWGSRFV